MPLNMRRIVTATVLTIAVGLAVVPEASAGRNFYRNLQMRCIVPSDTTMQVSVKHQIGVHPHPANNLRSMSAQARLEPVNPPIGLPWADRWGFKVRTTKPYGDGPANVAFWTGTGEHAVDNYNVEVSIRWDRKHAPDWKFKKLYAFNEGFCEGGSFPG